LSARNLGALEGFALDLLAQLAHAPALFDALLGVKTARGRSLDRQQDHHVTPTQLSRQRRDNLGLREGRSKLHHAQQILDLKTTSKFLSQLATQAGHELAAILRTFTAQHLGGQALPQAPVQAGQLGVDSASLTLATADDESTQFGMQPFDNFIVHSRQ
jgi:hypothetical protein